MKAVILANEKSENLSPLNENKPKGMLSIMNRPCVSFIAELLSLNGIEQCAVIAGEEVKEYFDNNPSDMEIKIFSSDTYRGSAGSLSLCKEFLNDDFLLIDGGCICDFDFREAFEYSKRKNALVTVVTAISNAPNEYGNVFSNKNGKVMRIYEKPGWEQVMGNSINTGIYICKKELLSFIGNSCLCFETQLLPKLLEIGEGVFEYQVKGYWNGLNSLSDYKQCNFDMLGGKVATVPLPARRSRNRFKTSSPIYVGRGVTADRSAIVGPNAVVGDGCFIGKNALLKNCVIGSNTVIGDNVVVSGIVGENCVLRPDSRVLETAVLGNGSILGRGSVVCRNTKVGRDKEIGDNLEVSHSLMGTDESVWLFGEREIEGDVKTGMTPVFASRLGYAAGEIFTGELIVGCKEHGATPFLSAFCASLSAKGVHVIKCECSVNELRYAAAKNSCPCVYIHSENNRLRVFIYNGDGSSLNYVQERKMQEAFFCENKIFASPTETVLPDVVMGTAVPYGKALERVIGKTSKKVLIYGENGLCTLFRRSVNHTGGGLSDELEFEFNENGIDLKVAEKDLSLDRPLICAILCLFESTKKLPIPYEMPKFLLSRIGVTNTLSYENAYEEYPYFFDSLFMAGRLLNIMEKTQKSLKELYLLLPEYCCVQREVRNKYKASVIACIKELIPAADTTGRGISITADNGVVNIIPLRRAEGFKVMAYSADTETSGELCGDMCDILKNIDIN